MKRCHGSIWREFLAAVQKKTKKQVRQGLENIFVKKNKEVEGVIEFAAGNTEIDV